MVDPVPRTAAVQDDPVIAAIDRVVRDLGVEDAITKHDGVAMQAGERVSETRARVAPKKSRPLVPVSTNEL